MIVLFYSLRVPGHETQLKCIRRRGFVCGEGGGKCFRTCFSKLQQTPGLPWQSPEPAGFGGFGGAPLRPPPSWLCPPSPRSLPVP